VNITGRPIMQKRPRVHIKALTDLAHESPCFATMPHECVESRGCDPAHNNWQAFGKGVGKKTSDWLVAFVCRNAHDILDGKVGKDTLSKELREYYWTEAFISTHDWLWNERLVRVS
jgi:hypothetical protein